MIALKIIILIFMCVSYGAAYKMHWAVAEWEKALSMFKNVMDLSKINLTSSSEAFYKHPEAATPESLLRLMLHTEVLTIASDFQHDKIFHQVMAAFEGNGIKLKHIFHDLKKRLDIPDTKFDVCKSAMVKMIKDVISTLPPMKVEKVVQKLKAKSFDFDPDLNQLLKSPAFMKLLLSLEDKGIAIKCFKGK